MTKEEKEVLDLLSEAHNKFADITQTHPADMQDWEHGIHQLQRIIMGRITRRDYSEEFKTIEA